MKRYTIPLTCMMSLLMLVPAISSGQDFRSRLFYPHASPVSGKYKANRAAVINYVDEQIHNVIAEYNTDDRLQITTLDQNGNILAAVSGIQFMYNGQNIDVVPVKMILADPLDPEYHCLEDVTDLTTDIILLGSAAINDYVHPCFIRLSHSGGGMYHIASGPVVYEGHLAPHYPHFDLNSGAFAADIIATVPRDDDAGVKYAITGTDVLYTTTSQTIEKAQPFIILVDGDGIMVESRAYELPVYTVASDSEIPGYNEVSASNSIVQIHNRCNDQVQEGYVIGGANIVGRSGFLIRTDAQLNIIDQRVDKANDSTHCPNGLWFLDLYYQPSNTEVYVLGASRDFGNIYSSIDIAGGGLAMPSVDNLATPGFNAFRLSNFSISNGWNDLDIYDHSNDFKNSRTGGLKPKVFNIDRFTTLMTYQSGTHGEGPNGVLSAIFQVDFSNPNDANPVNNLSKYITFPNGTSSWGHVASPSQDALGVLAWGNGVDRISLMPERQIGANLRSGVLADLLGDLALYNYWSQLYEQYLLWQENSTTIMASNFWNSCKTQHESFQNDQFFASKVFGHFTELPGPVEIGMADGNDIIYPLYVTTCDQQPDFFRLSKGVDSVEKSLTVLQGNNELIVKSESDLYQTPFTVYDISGKLVQKGTLKSDFSIDISLLSSGLHILVLDDTSGELLRHKFVR